MNRRLAKLNSSSVVNDRSSYPKSGGVVQTKHSEVLSYRRDSPIMPSHTSDGRRDDVLQGVPLTDTSWTQVWYLFNSLSTLHAFFTSV